MNTLNLIWLLQFLYNTCISNTFPNQQGIAIGHVETFIEYTLSFKVKVLAVGTISNFRSIIMIGNW